MTPEQIAQYKVDRTGWPTGRWDNEPDRVDFITRAGLPGLMLRQQSGHWCGYVGVGSGHSAYRKDYDDVPCRVHGGLTYSRECSGDVCHVPAPDTPEDLWWLGFDCHHAFDYAPGDGFFGIPFNDFQEYRDQEYVRDQVESLAEQLSGSLEPQ